MTRALAVLLAFAPAALAEEPAKDRRPVPAFELESLQGDRVSLASLEGKVVVVSFWATWCVPCKQELDYLQKVYEDHAEKGFTVLAIATDGPETQSKIRTVVKQKKWGFPVLLDTDGRAMAILNPRGLTPYTMFVDRKGRLAFDHEGFSTGDGEKHRAKVETLLAEPPGEKTE
jgi:peroxiredoxin